MNYQTYKPHQDLESIVKFYWTLEVPFDPNNQKQKIVPDGCIEMTFNFGNPIKRFVSGKDFVFQSKAMLMGQRTQTFEILPAGHVDTFAICFYPIGFANFVDLSLDKWLDQEVPLSEVFEAGEAYVLEQQIMQAASTQERIVHIEGFLLRKLKEHDTISHIVRSTVDSLLQSNGSAPIHTLVKEEGGQRRQLERHFKKQIGISPKQLGKAIRLQTTLHLLLNKKNETLTDIAYESEYFDQNHFIKDFKDLMGLSPKEFLNSEQMALSSLFYK